MVDDEGQGTFHHTTSVLRSQHWLKVPQHIHYKNIISYLQYSSNLSTIWHSPITHHPTARVYSYLSLSRPQSYCLWSGEGGTWAERRGIINPFPRVFRESALIASRLNYCHSFVLVFTSRKCWSCNHSSEPFGWFIYSQFPQRIDSSAVKINEIW